MHALAEQSDIPSALAKFEATLTLDSDLDIDPEDFH